jgi:hypothetical protein
MGGIVVEREEGSEAAAGPARSMGGARRAEPTFGETIRRRNPDE